MTAQQAPERDEIKATLGQVYLACPLTGLTPAARRQIISDVALVCGAVENETLLDRPAGDEWPLNVYAPIARTAPWLEDGLSPQQVYERNLQAVHDSDALIILAEKGGSAGVGQELEWAIRLGIPVLFLTADEHISRQISGAPAFILAQSYNKDAATLQLHVRNFLRLWKPMILDGPRRRESRRLRFQPLALRLAAAWQGCRNRTELAAQVRVDLRSLELALANPAYLATMATDTLLALARELGVALHALDRGPTFTLPVTTLRALMAAASDCGWSDEDVRRMLHLGRAAIESAESFDLDTIAGWRALHRRLEG